MRVARLKKWTEKFFFVEHDEEVMCLICKHRAAVTNC